MILLASAVVSLGLALFEEGQGLTAFVDPIVVSKVWQLIDAICHLLTAA